MKRREKKRGFGGDGDDYKARSQPLAGLFQGTVIAGLERQVLTDLKRSREYLHV